MDAVGQLRPMDFGQAGFQSGGQDGSGQHDVSKQQEHG